MFTEGVLRILPPEQIEQQNQQTTAGRSIAMGPKKPTEFDQVYPPDYEAAQELVKQRPDVLEMSEDLKQHPNVQVVAEVMKYRVEYLAGLHARLGPREFKLIHGLEHPRHPVEALFIDVRSGVISGTDLKARGEAIDHLPVTLEILAGFLEDLSEANVHYDQMLSRVRTEARRDESDPPDATDIQTICYYARELKRKYSVTKYHLHAIQTLAEECRAGAGRPLPMHGQLSASTAMQLARDYHDVASDHWFRLLRLEKSWQLDPHVYDPALHRFRKDILPQLPEAGWLQTTVSEEFALVRLFLRKHGPYSVDEAHAIYGTPPVAVGEVEPQVPIESVGAIRKPTLTNWAFGYDGTGKWYMFHKDDGRWEKPGQVTFQGGMPSELMLLLAEHGGRLDRPATIAWLGERQPLLSELRRRDSIKEGISRARNSIRVALGNVGKFDKASIPDPLPLFDETWIAAVEIGFAMQNDFGRLEFKRKEHM